MSTSTILTLSAVCVGLVVVCCSTAAVALVMNNGILDLTAFNSDWGYGFLFGCISALVVPPLSNWCSKALRACISGGSTRTDIYGLEHALLNVEMPPRSMWMNMGFWKEKDITFPDACKALLNEVLKEAGLLDQNGQVSRLPSSCRVNLVDVGFGCGDQTIYLARNLSRKSDRREAANPSTSLPLFDNYLGISITRSQVEYAMERLASFSTLPTALAVPCAATSTVRLFCADAARPQSWSPDLQAAISNLSPSSASQVTWVLALDTLYHFAPSRRPFFCYARRHLRASIMGFDLFLSDSASPLDLCLIRLVCWFGAIPYANLMTMEKYKDMLEEVGYPREEIRIRDLSDHVFHGISSFIWAKESNLRRFGMSTGRFKATALIFSWWARKKIIKGGVIVTINSSFKK